MLHSEYHNHNPKIKQTRQFFPSPEQYDFWGYVSIAYHPRNDVLVKWHYKNENIERISFFNKFKQGEKRGPSKK